MVKRTFLILFCFMFVWHFLLPGEPELKGNNSLKPVYRAKRTAAKIKIDGHIDEKAWEDALVLDVNNEIMPSQNIPAPVKTQCLILYDDKNIYFAFKAQDPQPSRIRAHLSDRDNIGQDDFLGVIIDTFNDQNRAFSFFVNPLGIQLDEIFSDGGSYEDISWDGIWNSDGHIGETGYEVEMAIPFRTLQFPRGSRELTWGFAPLRIYPRSRLHQISNFTYTRNNACYICQFNQLTGIEDVPPALNIELDPTLTALRTDVRDLFPDGPLEKKVSKVEAGISAHWGITSNLTLSAAVNPDFSQVEADIAQLDINTQFALYYPEKRTFFLEGKDFFSTPIKAVYTRNLADPYWGLKLSGKEGKNALGLFINRDKITNLLFPAAENSAYTTLNQASTASVIRYRRDIGASSSIGILFTGREGKDYYNRVAGVDTLWRLSKSDSIHFQVLGAFTRYPLASAEKFQQKNRRMSGYGIDFSYRRSRRSYGWNLDYENFSPDFRADLGYIPRVDYRKGLVGGNYTFWGKKDAFFSRIIVGGVLSQVNTHGGRLLERRIALFTDIYMPLQSIFSVDAGNEKKIYNHVSFNQVFWSFAFHFYPSGNFNLDLYSDIRDEIDYLHTRGGKYFRIQPVISYNLGRNFRASLSYSYSHLDVTGGRLFETHLAQGKLVYHFNRNVFLRGIFQYTKISRDSALYVFPVDPLYRHLFMQFLFSYKINPRTVLFLGYSDNYNGLPDMSLAQSDRTFFFKVGYALSI